MDKSQVYWSYGGSTVLTKNFVRLTPSTQDRRGWLWNEYPLESDNWEVEFKTEIFSKPHFGGDGFGFWVVSSDQDPAYSEADALLGPAFGMRKDFKGFGVMFDVYDNDHRRNNPSIFVLTNFDGGEFMYNHDNDFENDMYTNKPANNFGSKGHSAHKCVADIRNTGKVSRVLVKYLHRVLHVYVDTADQQGYKFCLAVEFEADRVFREHSIAFTAATGQVADNHDIMEISTRYLDEGEREFNDAMLAQLGDSSSSHRFSFLFLTIAVFVNIILLAYSVYEFVTFRAVVNSHIDSVRFCQKFNQYLIPHYIAHAAVTAYLLLFGEWWLLLLNLPLALHRAYLYKMNQYLLSPDSIELKLQRGFALSNTQRQIITIVVYLLSFMLLASRMF